MCRTKQKEQVLSGISTKTKMLIVSKKKVFTFGTSNVNNFHFQSLFPQEKRKLVIKRFWCIPASNPSWVGGRGIRIGVYCTLLNVLKILTGLDQVSIYFVIDPRLLRHKFWNQPFLFNQAIFYTWLKFQDKNLSKYMRSSRTW